MLISIHFTVNQDDGAAAETLPDAGLFTVKERTAVTVWMPTVSVAVAVTVYRPDGHPGPYTVYVGPLVKDGDWNVPAWPLVHRYVSLYTTLATPTLSLALTEKVIVPFMVDFAAGEVMDIAGGVLLEVNVTVGDVYEFPALSWATA